MPVPVRIALSLLLITFFTLPLSSTASAQTALLLSEDFEDQTDLSPFSAVSVASNIDWSLRTFRSDSYASMNGFDADEASEDWLISPALDFSNSTGETLTFEHTRGFSGGDFEVLFSTDYAGTGDPNAATWTNVTAQANLSPGDFENVSSGDIDISANASSVYVAFKYTSTGAAAGEAANHDVDNVEVFANVMNPVLSFTSTSALVREGDGTVTLTVEQVQPNGSATDVDVALTSGDAADVGSYTTQTVSFPSSATGTTTEDVTVPITEDMATELDETFTFSLQNPTGAALLGQANTFTLTIADDDNSLDIVINEILADPASGTNGDANGDGTRDSGDDEFVEIYNTGSTTIDISGFQIEDGFTTRHVVPAGTTLEPGVALVVFGGGTPTGIPGVVQTASTGSLSLNNSGDTVILTDDNGDPIVGQTYGDEGGDDESLTRSPDFTGDFVQHSTAAGAGGALFSPGRTVDGRPLPVELSAFDVSTSGQDAELRWTTASEADNAGFRILHQAPGAAWTSTGFVKGAGTATTPQAYSFSVPNLHAGNHSFRLEQVDLDGATMLHEPQTLRIAAVTSVSLSGPNPLRTGMSAQLTINVTHEQDVEAHLYNVLGQRVQTVYVGPAAPSRPVEATFSATGIASGVYFLRVTGPSLHLTERVAIVR